MDPIKEDTQQKPGEKKTEQSTPKNPVSTPHQKLRITGRRGL
eukprot:UN07602